MAQGDRNTIRETVAEALETELSIPFFDYSPDRVEVVFDSLPAGVVDWDPGRSERWASIDQGMERRSYLFVEIYEPILDSDEDYGKRASEEIATKVEQAEALLRTNTYLNNTCDGSEIVESKIEPIAVEVEESGIKARLGWIVLEVLVVR